MAEDGENGSEDPEAEIDEFSLQDGEEIVHDVRPSLVGFLFDDSGHIVVGTMTLLVLPYLWAKNSRILVTDRRVVKHVTEWGVGDERTEEVAVDDILTVNSTQVYYENVFGAGQIHLSTDGAGTMSLYSLEDYETVADDVAEMAGVEHTRG